MNTCGMLLKRMVLLLQANTVLITVLCYVRVAAHLVFGRRVAVFWLHNDVRGHRGT